MREIKFRAWDTKHKEMLKPSTLEEIIIGMTEAGSYYGKMSYSVYNQAIHMQYTGLKDKNGEEIYEGDIIQWWNKVNRSQVVETTDGGWNPFIDDMQTDSSWHYVIIGNIYENPELLEVKEATK